MIKNYLYKLIQVSKSKKDKSFPASYLCLILGNKAIVFLLLFFFSNNLFSQTTDTYTGNGTWTAPTNVISATVECWGGGGAGGGSQSDNAWLIICLGGTTRAGGGGGGAYASSVVSVVPGTGYAIAVGTGGTGAANAAGGTGGNSSFASTTVVAAGGTGGSRAGANSNSGGGAGGTTAASTGTTKNAGGTGATATNSGSGGGGGGAGTTGGTNGGVTSGGAGGTGAGAGGGGRTSTNPGIAGVGIGGGGGGGYSAPCSNTDEPGGNGYAGQVKVTYTACTNPTTQANTFSASSIAGNSMTLNWARGNGNNVLVIARAGSAPTDPTSGVTYTGNAAYGSGTAVGGGYAVYVGTGTSVSLTGLASGTTYYFAVYEYATTGPCYNLTELTSSATTTTPYKATFTGMSIGSVNWCAGETRTVSVTVTNSGTSTWTDAAPDVNVGIKWDADPDYLVRVDAGGLAPGASHTYNLTVTAPATTGTNHLTFDVVKEGDCWFGGNGGSCGPGNSVYGSTALTINALPATPTAITGSSSVTCNATITLASTPTGGTWTSSTTAVATVNPINGVVTGAAGVASSSTSTISYYVTNAASCNSASVTKVVTVPGVPTAVTASASPNPVCTGSTLSLTGSATGATSWGWTGPNGFTSTSQSPTVSTNVTSAMAGTYALTVTNACGSAATVNTSAVTVTTLPAATISYAGSPFCISVGAGQAVTLTGTAGGTYSSTAGLTINAATGAINPSTSTAGVYTVTYTIAAASGCAQVTATCSVTIKALPAITGQPASPAAINAGAGAAVFTVTATGGSITYQWQEGISGVWTNITNGGVYSGGTSTSLTITNPPGSMNGYNYRCVVSGCAPSATSNGVAALSVLTVGNPTPCYGTTQNYYVTNVAGVTYTWTYPAGWSVVSGQGTNSINLLVGVNSGNVTVTPSNCSGNGTARTLAVTVASVSIGATATTICSGTSVTFTATPLNAGTPTYQWTKNGTDIAGATSSTYVSSSIANTDAIAVKMTSTSGCLLTSTPINMVVNPANVTTSVTISASSSNICSGVNTTFTAVPVNPGSNPTYQWKNNGVNIGGATASTYTSSTLTNGNSITVVLTNSDPCVLGSPATSNAIVMTVNASLTASVAITPAAPAAICTGTGVTFTAAPTNGGTPTYQWKNGGANVGTNSTTYTSTTLANNDVITVQMTSSLPCTTPLPAISNAVTMTVNSPISGNTISASQVICTGSTPVALTGGALSGGNGAYTYLWESSTTSSTAGFAAASGTNNTAGYTPTGAFTQNTWFRRTVTSAPCASDVSQAIQITVNTAILNNTINTPQSICSGTPPLPITGTVPTGGNGIYTYLWEISTTSGVAGFSTIGGATSQDYSPGNLTVNTWYRRTVTSAPCASNVSSAIAITINPNLPASVSIAASATAVCNGTTVVFTPTPTNGGTNTTYQWQKNGSDISGEVYSNYTTSTLVNGDVIRVVMTSDASPCLTGSPATSNAITMTVNAIPVATATNSSQTKCSAVAITTMVLSTSNGVAGTTYAWTRDNTTNVTGIAASGSGNIAGTLTNTTSTDQTVVFTIIPTGPAATNCAGSAITATVIVSPAAPAAPTSISGVATVYAGFTEPYTTPAVTNATTYTWTVPAGWTIVSGQGTTTLRVTAGTAGQNGNITVTAGNSCSTSAAYSYPVTVIANTTANTTPCQGTTQYYATQYRDGVSYRWSVPSDWRITAGANSNAITVIAGAVSGNVTVTEYNSCGDGTVQTLAINPNPRPAVTTTSGYACSGTALSIALSSTPAVATTYSWIAADNANTTGESLTNQSGATINNTITINSGAITTVTYSVIPTVTATGCVGNAGGVGPQIVTATINPAGYWTGLANPDRSWYTVGNWCSVPSCGADAFIPTSPVGNQFPQIGAGTYAGVTAVCRNLTISTGASLDLLTTYSLNVCGDWLNYGTFTPASGKVVFTGSANQNVGGAATNGFYDLEINNTGTLPANHVTLTQPATVSDQLTLTQGILMTSDSTLLTLTNSANTATTSGKSTSYVSGPIRWNGINGVGPYVFPTGKGNTKWARIAIQDLTAATDFQAEYFNTSFTNVSAADMAATPTPVLKRVSAKEYWHFYRVGAGNGRVTLYWEDANWSGISNCAVGGPLKIAHWDPSNATNSGGTMGSWENNNTRVTPTGTCGVSGSITTNVVVSEFSPFTFGDTTISVNPLPVELLYFTAVYNGKTVDLNWQTASEINNDYFTVERSLDGIHFTTVGVVPSLAKGGNSTSMLTYYLNDDKVTPGVYYYRLKQTDFNGEYKYSNIDMVEIKGDADFAFNIAPNPGDGTVLNAIISAERGQEIVVVVHDILGQELYSKVIITEQKGNAVYGIDLSHKLSSGVYMITATSNQKVYSKRLVVN